MFQSIDELDQYYLESDLLDGEFEIRCPITERSLGFGHWDSERARPGRIRWMRESHVRKRISHGCYHVGDNDFDRQSLVFKFGKWHLTFTELIGDENCFTIETNVNIIDSHDAYLWLELWFPECLAEHFRECPVDCSDAVSNVYVCGESVGTMAKINHKTLKQLRDAFLAREKVHGGGDRIRDLIDSYPMLDRFIVKPGKPKGGYFMLPAPPR